MLSLGSLAVLTPWVLGALVLLPAVWWLLRITPPAPKRQIFPAIRFLRNLERQEETSARTPWWLVALRMLILALIIVGLAQPVLNPQTLPPGTGPMVIAVDNGWGAAKHWDARVRTLAGILDHAARSERRVVIAATAPERQDGPPPLFGPMRAEAAREVATGLRPQPWPARPDLVTGALQKLSLGGSLSGIWLSDGLKADGGAALAQHLGRYANSQVYRPERGKTAHLLRAPQREPDALVVRAARAARGAESTIRVRALAGDGRILTRQPLTFAADARTAEQALRVPAALLNQIARLQIENEASAGATWLLDDSWKRRPVGIVSSEAEVNASPLLSDSYYLERALSPFSEVRKGGVIELLDAPLAVLVLADQGQLTGGERTQITSWVEQGGVLIRFAGPRMAQARFAPDDPLLPVPLRLGDRSLGGALSWSEPAPLAALSEDSPLAGLELPEGVMVRRQILAEPTLDLSERSWARLADGTPLITGTRRAQGWVVMVHTTAGPAWSDLSLSGFYVDLLRRLTELSAGVAAGNGERLLNPLQVLDGYGRLTAPSADLSPVNSNALNDAPIGAGMPPGYYGTRDNRRALNLGVARTSLAPMPGIPDHTDVMDYTRRSEQSLRPALLTGALLLALMDLLLSLWLRGLAVRPKLPLGRGRTAAMLAAAMLAGTLTAPPAMAQDGDLERALKVTKGTWFAYVRTGDSTLDATSRDGLRGLSQVLNQRTSVDARGVVGIDIEQDVLAFYPLVYWPISVDQPAPSDAALAKINAYLRSGGTVFFDTRDQERGTEAVTKLRQVADGLDVPSLVPVPTDHVLTKSFYLLDEFPGRYASGTVWVQNAQGDRLDGVSPVIIGSNDYAAAWAIDDLGQPRFPVIPGDRRQRELARRFGVNLVMYVLTGNYKADQVHVPYILERLGQ